ncbi:sigma-70 family RNA polymerase sigma factor [Verrucomicrobia bacterium]|nr:sigma-70 family RNA polymerase sigma factor [Verrucomicrobiota bacterium]
MADIDIKQISEWFEAHSKAMVLFASQFVDRAEAEDVIQDVFIRMQSHANIPRDVKAWLYRSVKNAALNRIRSRDRRKVRETTAHEESTTWFDARPEDVIDAEQARQLLMNLDESEREIVVLKIWAGLTFEQIAGISERSRSSVFRIYEKSIRTMRQQLESPHERI